MDIFTNVFNSPIIQATANASQLTDLALNLKQVSNDKIMKELLYQNDNYLEYIVQILDNYKHLNDTIISNQEIIISQNNKIINLITNNI